MASRDLKDAHPDLRAKVEKLIDLAADIGIDLLVTSVYRSIGEQDELYAQGRTLPGKVVTWARGGQSDHNATLLDGTPASRAVDVCFVVERNTSGKAVRVTWDGPWNTIGWMAIELCGLRWGGLWKGKKQDRPHFYIAEAAEV